MQVAFLEEEQKAHLHRRQLLKPEACPEACCDFLVLRLLDLGSLLTQRLTNSAILGQSFCSKPVEAPEHTD